MHRASEQMKDRNTESFGEFVGNRRRRIDSVANLTCPRPRDRDEGQIRDLWRKEGRNQSGVGLDPSILEIMNQAAGQGRNVRTPLAPVDRRGEPEGLLWKTAVGNVHTGQRQ